MPAQRIFLVFFLSLLFACTHAQVFQKTYGAAIDQQAFCVRQTTDAGYVICGNIVIDSVNTDLFLLKTNAAGDTSWFKKYGGTSNENEGIVQQTSDGGYILCGSTNSFGAGSGDILVIKANANGDTSWTRTYGGAGDEIGQFIQQTFDNGYIIGGHTDTYGVKGDFYLIRIKSNGDTLWTRNYGGAKHDHGFCVQQTNDTGFILVGHSVSFGVTGGFYVVKTKANGDTMWSRGYGGLLDSYCYAVRQTSDGGYILAGTTSSFGAGQNDAMVVKIDATGDTIWARTYGSAHDEFFNCVRQTYDGGYILAGAVSGGTDTSDMYLVKIDAAGDTLWTRTFGGTKYDDGMFVDICADSGYVVCGTSKSVGSGKSEIYLVRTDRFGNAGCVGPPAITVITKPDSVMHYLATSMGTPPTHVGGAALIFARNTLSVTDACSTFGIKSYSENEFSQRIFPSPTTGILHLQSAEPIGSFRIFNYCGQLCYERFYFGATNASIDIGHLAPGLYLAEVGGRRFKIVKE